MSMPTKFTPERVAIILDTLRQGAMLAGAACCAGITRQTLHNWMTSTEEKFLAFQEDVELARGVARAQIEMHVYRKDPKFWLLSGPGRERYDNEGNLVEEGWARPSRPRKPSRRMPMDGEEMETAILAAVQQSPDLRAKLVAAAAAVEGASASPSVVQVKDAKPVSLPANAIGVKNVKNGPGVGAVDTSKISITGAALASEGK